MSSTNQINRWFRAIVIIAGFLFVMSVAGPALADVEVLEPDFTVETFAIYSKPGMGNPRGMDFDDDGNLYVVQQAGESVWKITPDRQASEFVSGLDQPRGIRWTGGTSYGDYLYITNNQQIVRIGLDGTRTNFANMPFNGTTVLAVDQTGNYGGHMYVGSAAHDRIYRVDTNGNDSLFSRFPYDQGGGGLYGLDFDPGTTYGGLMYVATLYSWTPNLSGVFVLSTSGNESRFTNDLAAGNFLRFDRTGEFYGQMFLSASTAIGGVRGIWRVRPDGTAIEFARTTISSPCGLTFGSDWAMYVVEYDGNDEATISRIRKIYVDDDGPYDPCHGVPGPSVGEPNLSDPLENGCRRHPFDSFQKAINDIINPTSATIIVLDGTYSGVGNYDIDTLGLAVTVKSQNGPNECIVDCNSLGRGFIIQNGESLDTVIDGFTIIDGNTAESGGAIDCNNSSPTIKNCLIEGNYAGWSGGAIFCQDSDAEITNCTITDNFCEVIGAGICGVGGLPVIKNCLITYNDGYYSGAASSIYDCNMTFINCTIADNIGNHPYLVTGGIYCWQGDANIVNTILWDNNSPVNEQIEFFMGDEVCTVTYSDVQIDDSNYVWVGTDNLNDDPLFAAPEFGDYHLKSAAGRWAQILKSNGDLNDDGIVDWLDLEIFVEYWLYTGEEIFVDMCREELIDFKDFAVFASYWLMTCQNRADFDDSNLVDWIDLGIFTKYWLDTGQEIPVELYYEALINFKDYAVLACNWLGPGVNVPGWIYTDTESSPCIDAGDPNYEYAEEPEPNGGRINMGAYGNTKYASKSPECVCK